MTNKLSFFSYLAIGFMLFALFFGAGNLIFPAQLGQYAGSNLWSASTGFLITGVGLPLLGILAMGFSGSSNLQELAGRVSPAYGIFFTSLLYLTIGPFFAAPRTGTVAYEIGVSTFVGENNQTTGLLVFSLVFFAIALLVSLYPGKLVNTIGKVLAPILVVLLTILLVFSILNPMGAIQEPQKGYDSGAFMTGFLEGYNTMDALASLVFGIIIINVIRSMGLTSKKEILSATAKTGVVAIALLGLIYLGIAYLGATSTSTLGFFDNGGPVLSGAASHFLGTFGSLVLAVVIILACLTTAIGLITANAEYFHTLLPSLSYKTLVVFFALITFTFANFGLANIINYSIPVLMFLYPLAVVLMLLTFLSPLFNHARIVYVSATVITLLISIVDGLKAFFSEYPNWLLTIVQFYDKYLPMYTQGLGWLLPALVVITVTGILARVLSLSTATQQQN
ncbi:branched-chain amino acid transport system II carrier protein [Bacillaceae bacterium W0354]